MSLKPEDVILTIPSPIEKQAVLLEYAKTHAISIFVETGTFYGETIAALYRDFKTLYSIELGDWLYEYNRQRFSPCDHVHIIHGDSGKELSNIVKTLHEPALFWLDGHYSGEGTARSDRDTPVVSEIKAIIEGRPFAHVVIIDDARLFGNDPAYPTVGEIIEIVKEVYPVANIEVKGDSIRIVLQ